MTAAHPRPRIVDVAFWSWLVAAALLVVGGAPPQFVSFKSVRAAVPAATSDQEIKTFVVIYKGVGILCLLLGAAIGYLATRMRQGDKRSRRNAVALSVAAMVLVAFGVLAHVATVIVLLALIALIVAVGLITRPIASAWFDEAGSSPEGDRA